MISDGINSPFVTSFPQKFLVLLVCLFTLLDYYIIFAPDTPREHLLLFLKQTKQSKENILKKQMGENKCTGWKKTGHFLCCRS